MPKSSATDPQSGRRRDLLARLLLLFSDRGMAARHPGEVRGSDASAPHTRLFGQVHVWTCNLPSAHGWERFHNLPHQHQRRLCARYVTSEHCSRRLRPRERASAPLMSTTGAAMTRCLTSRPTMRTLSRCCLASRWPAAVPIPVALKCRHLKIVASGLADQLRAAHLIGPYPGVF